MIKSGGIEGEGIKRCFNLTFLRPLAGEWVGIGALQGKHAMLEHSQLIKRLSMGSGKIDVPLAVDAVHFRCPDELAHRAAFRFTPDDNGVGGAQPFQRISPADFQPVIFRYGGNKVVIAAVA
ncbi:Uncharacterised protein [Salmonella enterica subsp. enterica serovar Bovismorbificans]|uniref:Uncharacterized protein n=1 Tax=Salmonella enterica subsp. enterica serovar Bovismorbificans TaxID=58097 RepID=A0A655CVW2_SALET|nr:Uncharacterised protein [Salmonella enterica subsp. enterica serovar Bovismorbificans]CPR52012.1 Uncharacterised protein [Salmonella enterica subsp. enterica serovar Bovismorbificans]